MAGQAVVVVDDLPGDALGAAARFHAVHIERVAAAVARGAQAVAVALPPAPADHADWRRAAARDLARAHAPVRVNLVAGRAGDILEETLGYLAAAPGVTGHFLQLAPGAGV